MKEIVLLIITLALLTPLVSIGQTVTDSTVCMSHGQYASIMYDLDNCDTIINHIDTVHTEVIIKDSIHTIIEYKLDKACEVEKKQLKDSKKKLSFYLVVSGVINLLLLIAAI